MPLGGPGCRVGVVPVVQLGEIDGFLSVLQNQHRSCRVQIEDRKVPVFLDIDDPLGIDDPCV